MFKESFILISLFVLEAFQNAGAQLLPPQASAILGADASIFTGSELAKIEKLAEKTPVFSPSTASASEEHSEEFILRELVIVQGENEDEVSFSTRVEQIVEEIKKGNFLALARENPVGQLQRKAGLLTPLTLNQIEPESRNAVKGLKVGETTAPITVSQAEGSRHIVIFYRRELPPVVRE